MAHGPRHHGLAAAARRRRSGEVRLRVVSHRDDERVRVQSGTGAEKGRCPFLWGRRAKKGGTRGCSMSAAWRLPAAQVSSLKSQVSIRPFEIGLSLL